MGLHETLLEIVLAFIAGLLGGLIWFFIERWLRLKEWGSE